MGFHLGKHLGMVLPGCMFNFIRYLQTVSSSGCTTLYPPQKGMSFCCCTFLSTLGIITVLNFSHSSGCVMVYLIVVSIWIFSNDIKHVFMCLLVFPVFSFVKCLLKSFAHLEKCLLIET